MPDASAEYFKPLNVAAIGVPGLLKLSVTAILNKSNNINMLDCCLRVCAKTVIVCAQKNCLSFNWNSCLDFIMRVPWASQVPFL